MVRKKPQPTFCNQHKTARNSKENVRTKVGFVFIIKEKKNSNSSGILTKEGNNFTLREQTPRYKITTVWTPDLSHLLQSRDGEETAEANKQFCKTKT